MRAVGLRLGADVNGSAATSEGVYFIELTSHHRCSSVCPSLSTYFDFFESCTPATMECLRSVAMLLGPAGPDGAVGARHVAAGGLHVLPVGVGLLVNHLEVTAQLGDELLAGDRTRAAPEVTGSKHIADDGLVLLLQRRGLGADGGAVGVDIAELIIDGHSVVLLTFERLRSLSFLR